MNNLKKKDKKDKDKDNERNLQSEINGTTLFPIST